MTKFQEWVSAYGPYRIAKTLGITYPAAKKWLLGGKPHPNRVAEIMRVSGLTRKQIMEGPNAK